jgi:hypothetical protein
MLAGQPPSLLRRRFFQEGLQGTLTVRSTLGPLLNAKGYIVTD